MRRRFSRILVFIVLFIGLALGFNFFSANFSGEGEASPSEALPEDASYEWIEGPKKEDAQRFFFLSNGKYFGTQVITKNFKGWTLGNRISSELPKDLNVNTVTAAYSDSEILFGLIKPDGEVKVTVNDRLTKRISTTSLSDEVQKEYSVEGFDIWYIDLSELDNPKNYLIQVLDENNSLTNELSI